jgi:predicted ATPase
MARVAIRTPDQRLRVFVSSTLQELVDERQAVREAIEGLRLVPVMFELGARPHPPRVLYRAYLEQSDVFVGLYWQRYGWVAPGEAVSGLEDEYRRAGDRPKLIYLKEPAPSREPPLAKLIAAIQADDQASYRRFGIADELRALVADDLAVLLSERFGVTGTQRAGSVLAAPDQRPLPRPLTRLIGREADMERLATILGDPSRRLVTVVGPGGVGKTRLALAVAERVRETYADGVFFVPLAGLAEPHLVIPTVARALGIAEEAGGDIGEMLRQALASAHCLVVLDNLEQVTDAVPELVGLIAATSRVQILATSRSVLDVSGEHVFELDPLEVPNDRDAHTSAVELFLARVADIRPDFVPADGDLTAIEELTRRLDGLPLAIELAAAQMRVLTPRGLLERMGHRRLEILRGGPRDLPARQQTLSETMSWSYELLDRGERTLFERLAVFVGSASLDAIEAITNPNGTLDTVGLLARLVEASLVRTIGEAGEVRFGMLETIREFANERLEAAGQAEYFRSRHADHYLALAAEGSLGLRGPEQLEWLDRFDRENDNFRAVFRRAIRRGQAGNGVRLGLRLLWFWLMRSLYAEGRSWMEAVRAIPGVTRHERAKAWTVDAMLAIWQGDFDLVEAGVDEAVESLRAARDAPTLGLALLLKASVGGIEPGRPLVREAAAEGAGILNAAGDPFLQGIACLGGSFVARRLGRLDEAAALAEQALGLSASVGDSFIRSSAATLLATTALERGALADVRARVLEALSTARALHNQSSSALSLELWAAAEMQDDRLERAGRLYALADRAYGLARAQPWRPDPLEESIDRLRDALGDRLDKLFVDARALDLDAAIADLARSQPMG